MSTADPSLIASLPAGLAARLQDADWQEVTFGYSGMRVFRVVPPGGRPSYLKVAPSPLAEELAAERDRLTWLRGRLGVPTIESYAIDGKLAFLLISAVPGTMACDPIFTAELPQLVARLGEGLRQLHQLEIADCPFDMRLDTQLARAEQRVRSGLVDEDDFDEPRQGMRAADLFAQLLRDRPAGEELVFTHGDYCLPNIMIDRQGGRLSGFIDLGRSGVADRHQDLALAARSLAYNFGPGWEPLLWESYGVATPDPAKIAYYQLLDEFF
jgi:aminoglycoside phosphotransferase